MPHRDFVAPPTTEADPPTFTLEEKEFTALPAPPGGTLADLFWAFQQRDITAKSAGTVRFILGCLSVDEAERFDLLIHDKDIAIPLGTLVEISIWLVEAYTDRPTTPSSGSDNGSTSTPDTPEDGADLPDSPSLELVSPT